MTVGGRRWVTHCTWCSVCLIFEAPPNRRLMRRLSCPTSTGAALAAVRVLTGKTPAIDAL